MKIFFFQGLAASQIEQVRRDLTSFLVEGAGKPCGITSLFLHLAPAKRTQVET